jgi:hypothetical protein
MAIITPFGIFIPTRFGFGGSNGPVYMRRLSDYVDGDLEDVCVNIDDTLIALFSIDYVGLFFTKDDIKPQEVHANTIIQFAVPQDVETLKIF